MKKSFVLGMVFIAAQAFATELSSQLETARNNYVTLLNVTKLENDGDLLRIGDFAASRSLIINGFENDIAEDADSYTSEEFLNRRLITFLRPHIINFTASDESVAESVLMQEMLYYHMLVDANQLIYRAGEEINGGNRNEKRIFCGGDLGIIWREEMINSIITHANLYLKANNSSEDTQAMAIEGYEAAAEILKVDLICRYGSLNSVTEEENVAITQDNAEETEVDASASEDVSSAVRQ